MKMVESKYLFPLRLLIALRFIHLDEFNLQLMQRNMFPYTSKSLRMVTILEK